MNNSVVLPHGVQLLERGWLSSNSVLLFDDHQATLIDTGYWTHSEQTVALIDKALCGRTLTEVLNTHLHSDHCGGNAALQAHHPHARLRIPPGHAAYVFDWDPAALTYTPTGQHCPPFTASGVLLPGETFSVGDMLWEVHAAPGHDPNSVIFFSPSHKLLVSADALWENGFGVVFPELEGVDAFGEVRATLDLIEKLAPQWVLPGHGAAFTEVSGALDRARKRLAGFEADPRKHGLYAAKVLLKFKLLELQRVDLEAFLEWASAGSYLQLLHQAHGAPLAMREWLLQLCEQLIQANAAKADGPDLVNC